MRPVLLELDGFASFRAETRVDFEGADLFVLSGPTGAGKSSLIDAMCFSLYGSVPRYDDKRLVAPVISQGQQQARVRFTFELDGERYTATRVVRRTKTGATTKEARLERLGDASTLAGTADELSQAVERILGLSFEHFTRTVVLPQGEFQEFLHAKPKERQDLLVELLDLAVYRQVAKRANQRARDAASHAGLLRSRLEDDLADATEDEVRQTSDRLQALRQLDERCAELRPELERLVEAGREARAGQQQAAARLEVVTSLTVPGDVADLHGELQRADEEVEQAARDLETAIAARERCEDAATELPTVAAFEAIRDELDRRDGLDERLGDAQRAATTTRDAAQAARTELQRAEAAHAAAVEAFRSLERRHAAHGLRMALGPGDACPVCERTIEQLPSQDAPPGLEDARDAVRRAEGLVAEQRTAASAAAEDAKAAATTVANLTEQLHQLDERVATAADQLGIPLERTAIVTKLDAARSAARALEAARAAERTTRSHLKRATETRESLREGERAAWRTFDETRDRLAAALSPHTPPNPDRDDLAGAWRALTDWADDRLPEVKKSVKEAEEAIETAQDRYRRRVDELLSWADEHSVEVGVRDPEQVFRAVASACASAEAARERATERLEQATKAREQLEGAEREAKLASELGTLLDARHFEQWLLNRALKHLVVGASSILAELTSGAYSLTVDQDGSFGVVDHRNADEVRSARTLSGGETFLASLSLALSLADHVAELAAHGSARLDALFLDEGFGTLDPDTLDTVAAAIEELGSRGRTVGLVTHVRELADRIPTRFEVRRTATTSTVERVEL